MGFVKAFLMDRILLFISKFAVRIPSIYGY